MVKKKSSMAPATGEHNAIHSYNKQYQVSAEIVYKSLLNGELLSLRVSDPMAQRVDDLYMICSSRVDAYQIKWSVHPSIMTKSDLLSGDDKALIRQLADGWKALSRQYAAEGKRVYVHLVTNHHASTSPIHEEVEHRLERHLSAFILQAWSPYRKSPRHTPFQIPAQWVPTWAEFQMTSGLDEVEFGEFVRCCDLELSYSTPNQGSDDLKQIEKMLVDLTADRSRLIHYSRNAILDKLGWSDRFRFQERHHFPVDHATYQPIHVTIQQLQKSLLQLKGGYVALVGAPGTGKSTLLTKTIDQLPGKSRFFRYYAFVPNSYYRVDYRGEYRHFLNDLVMQMGRAGFDETDTPIYGDETALFKVFCEQVELLKKDYLETSTKTYILLDGLDHIPREKSGGDSFLRYLLTPKLVPEGVYFLLGTQTLDPLNSDIRTNIGNEPLRCIQMQPLTQSDVEKILTQMGVFLQTNQMKRAIELTEGHPLALQYLASRLLEASSEEETDRFLNETVQYGGSIEEQYLKYWESFSEDSPEFIEFLSLISRLRDGIQIDWVERSFDEDSKLTQAKLSKLQKIKHFFRQESGNVWYFFHNSFRLFLINQTNQWIRGKDSEARDPIFHSKLANICARSPAPYCWEKAYHLHMAGESHTLLKEINSNWMNTQFKSFRPIEEIREDLKFALQAAVQLQEGPAMIRISSLYVQFERLQKCFDREWVVKMLIRTGETKKAMRNLHSGNQLRVSTRDALSLCLELLLAQQLTEAEKVFRLAEPDFIHKAMADENTTSNNQGSKLFIEWSVFRN